MIRVPEKTSKYNKEPEFDEYVVLFAPELISFIKEHGKARTYRFGLKYDYLVMGDNVKIQNHDDKEITFQAEIMNKQRVAFGEIPINTEGHESYRDKEHQREVFSGYYAYLGRKIQDDDLFLMIDFKLT